MSDQVATWSGSVHPAFVIDAFRRFIVGWHISRPVATELALDSWTVCGGESATPWMERPA